MKYSKKNKSLYLSFFLISFSLFVFVLSFFNLYSYFDKKNTDIVLPQPAEIQKKEFWIDFLEKNPTYINGWIELAKLDTQLNNAQEVKKSYSQVERLDPNYKVSN